jgi:tetratricopeptide (TPR) repeat protein
VASPDRQLSLMRICLCVCFFLTIATGWGQNVLPDSIAKRFDHLPQDSTLVTQLNRLSSSYMTSHPALSRSVASYAADVARRVQFNSGYARSLTVIGNSYWQEGIYEFAQNYYMLAARYYQQSRDSIGLGYVYNNIGEVHKKLGDLDLALTYLKLSIDLRSSDTTIAISLINIAELYVLQKKYSDAIRFATSAVNAAKKYNDQKSVTYYNWMMGKILLAQQSLNEALPFFENAVEGWKRSNELRALIRTYHDLAEAYRLQNNLTKASHYLGLVEDLHKKIHVPDLMVQTYFQLAKLDSSRHDFAGAYMNLVRHNALKDSIYNISKVEQIARVQAIYENERIDRENEQLRAEKKLDQEQLYSREKLLMAITAGLFVVLILATTLFQQRSKILKTNNVLQLKNDEIQSQKESIEMQAHTLMKLNEELNLLNKTLETRIHEGSKKLIVQNQKLAEYSFVNAHKLRAPVASILGLIQLLDQANPDDRDLILKHLKTCGTQLDAVIQEISKNLASDKV